MKMDDTIEGKVIKSFRKGYSLVEICFTDGTILKIQAKAKTQQANTWSKAFGIAYIDTNIRKERDFGIELD